MAKFQRQNELKDLGFLPLKRDGYGYCLTYGQGHNGTFPIEYREWANSHHYEILFLDLPVETDVLTWDQELVYIKNAIDYLANIQERNHARACTASTN